MAVRSFAGRIRDTACLVAGLGLILTLMAPAAFAQDAKPSLSITAADFDAGTVEITNHGDAEIDPNGLFLCNFPAYAPIAGAPTITAGQTITIDAASLGIPLDAATGELGLYATPDYANPDAIVSYVEWGETGHTRAPVAIEAGVWADGTAEVADGVISAVVPNPTMPDSWVVPIAEEPEGSGQSGDEESGELAQTGSNATVPMLLAAGVLLAAGLGLVWSARRHTV